MNAMFGQRLIFRGWLFTVAAAFSIAIVAPQETQAAYGQTQQPPPATTDPKSNVIRRPADPVVVNGKRATDMTPEEMREFLQGKVKEIEQSKGVVNMLKLAPGYPLTLTFDSPPLGAVFGDTGLVTTKTLGRTLILSAAQRKGDTSMQVIFPGNSLFVYHIFITNNFADADTAFQVSTLENKGPRQRPYRQETYGGGALGADDITSAATVIANYDAMLQEGAISSSSVKRIDIFRKSESSGFTIYSLYRFKDGKVAISFAYTNPYGHPQRFSESRLRVQLQESLFIPDYTSFQKLQLTAGETTTGFLVLKNPPFSFSQPLEIVWK